MPLRTLLTALLVLWCGFARQAAAEEPGHVVQRRGVAMGTTVQIQIYLRATEDEEAADRAMERAFQEFTRLERLMTTWREDSDVSRVNAAAGAPAGVPVSPEVFEVLRRSLEFSRLSDGAFDISYYALKGLWRFDDDLQPALPDPAALKERLRLISWRHIRLDPRRRTAALAQAGMKINLGGIGKGYAVDAASATLKRAGFPNHIVQAGGDLLLSGTKGGQPWKAGVRDPRGAADDFFAVVALSDHAFSTAGDYERSFVLAGRRYHHIIDPRTGYPATAARSVTIYARDATTADGLDDAVLILGPAAGLRLCERIADVGAIIVDADNRVHISRRLQGKVTLVHPPTPGL